MNRARIEKKLAEWERKTEVRREEVFNTLKSVGFTVTMPSGGSHIKAKHPDLNDVREFGILANMMIPVKGNYIKARYVKRAITAVKFVLEGK